MQKKIVMVNLAVASTFILFVGCASKSSKIPPVAASAVTVTEYKSLTCEQLKNSYSQLETKNRITAMRQDEIAKSDAVLISWGWILYGVPYIFLDGDGALRKEYEVDLGKLQAMEQAMKETGCIAR